MGGGQSKPAPPPTVIEQEPPAGSGQSSIIYPERPDTPRLDGISRSLANECSQCILQVASGISSSSVKISREFGEVSEVQCRKYTTDLKNVRDKKMSFQDFIGNLQAGRYLRNLNNGYCEQIELSGEELSKVTKLEQFDESKLRSVRIQKVSSGGFSSDTKAKLTPSIPFKLSFNGQEINVKSMAVYHPCPLRLEGIQADAVLSLNDPGFEDSNYVVLIPLVSRNSGSPSTQFFDTVFSQISTVTAPDPTGQYPIRNVPVGNNWSLTKVFNTLPTGTGALEVTNGFYEWKGMPALERKREDGNGTITYSWVESGKPSPRYIMLDTPVDVSPNSLATVTQSLPVTPSTDAVHAVLYSSNPMQRGIVHKAGPPGSSYSCGTRETFTDLQGVYDAAKKEYGTQEEDEACDAWTYWANRGTRGFTTQQITTMIFNAMVFIAMAVGAYLALAAVLRMYDVEAAGFSQGVGKVTAVFFKNLQQKTAALRNAVPLGLPMGPGALRALSKGDAAKLEGTTKNSQLEDLAKNEALGDAAAIPALPMPTVVPGMPLALPTPTTTTTTPSEKVGESFLPTPEGQRKRGVFKTGTLGRGRIIHGRDRDGSTRRGGR